MYLYIIGAVLLLAALYIHFSKAGPTRKYNVDLTGKIVIITGCSAGVGKEAARKIAAHNATIVFACRNQQKTMPILNEIKRQTKNNNLHFIELNLSDYDSVRQFANEFRKSYKQLDILINNAGIGGFKTDVTNKHGHQLTFATNHLGPFLLTELLQDLLTKQSRIINVSSLYHTEIKQSTSDFSNAIKGVNCTAQFEYAMSKFCNVLHAQGLQKQFDQEHRDIKVVSLHPGVVRTEIFSEKNLGKVFAIIFSILIKVFYLFTLSEVQGAQTTIYCALQDYNELVPAGYYEKNKLSSASQYARTCGLEDKMWQVCREAVQLI